ncbi:MAG: DUF6504 family protein [Kineosporiaceae bacterium]
MGHLYGDLIEVRGADGAVVTFQPEAADPAVASGPIGNGPAVPSGGGLGTVVAPASFLWRGRVYLVRGVLARWRERLPWWSSPAARLTRGDLPADPLEGSDEGTAAEADGWLQPFRGFRAGGDDRPARGSEVTREPVPGQALPLEREVWRVEACCGRQAPVGVFDLCRDLAPEEAALTVFDVPGSVRPPAGEPVPARSLAAAGTSGSWRLLRVCD